MTANELRIGNCVWSNDGHYDRVEDAITAIERGRVSTRFCKARYIPIEYIEAIPLTEEWLFRMGFEKSMMWTWFIDIKGNTKLVYYVGTRSWSLNFRNDGEFTCKHVHQLQNLYFALTGEELTIKEQ